MIHFTFPGQRILITNKIISSKISFSNSKLFFIGQKIFSCSKTVSVEISTIDDATVDHLLIEGHFTLYKNNTHLSM